MSDSITMIKERLLAAVSDLWQPGGDLVRHYTAGRLSGGEALKTAMLRHLRQTLPRDFFARNNLRLLWEYPYPSQPSGAGKERADLVIVQVDPHKSGPLAGQITKHIAVIDLRYLNSRAAAQSFRRYLDKLSGYLARTDTWLDTVDLYVCAADTSPDRPQWWRPSSPGAGQRVFGFAAYLRAGKSLAMRWDRLPVTARILMSPKGS